MQIRTIRLFRAAFLSAATIALFAGAASLASAQSNASGNLAGRAETGDQVTVTNPKTGFSRTITVGSSGRYRLASLPTGAYVVTVMHADGKVVLSRPVQVRLGETTTIRPEEAAKK